MQCECHFENINNDSKFEFNSFLIYVRVQPHSCVQYVHMGGYISSKITFPRQIEISTTHKKITISRKAQEKIHYQNEIVWCGVTETETEKRKICYLCKF